MCVSMLYNYFLFFQSSVFVGIFKRSDGGTPAISTYAPGADDLGFCQLPDSISAKAGTIYVSLRCTTNRGIVFQPDHLPLMLYGTD